MPTSTAGSTSLASSGDDPTRSTAPTKPLVYFGSFQDLLGRDKRGQHQAEETTGSTRSTGISSSSTSTTSARGATPRRSCSRARTTRSPQKETKLEYATRPRECQRRPRRALGERDGVPAHHDQGVPLPLRHAVQGAGDGRVHRGADLQLDVHRRAARQGGVRARRTRASGTPTARCRRCACSPTRCRTSCWRSPARASSTSSTSTSSSRPPARARARSSSTRTTCRSGSTSSAAPTRRPRSTTSSSEAAPAVSVLRRAAAAVPAALVLVPAERRRLSRDGEPAGREAQHVLARLQGAHRRGCRRRASGWMRCRPCARPSAAASTQRRSRCPAASSPPASPCRSGRRS